jgi:CDP-glucose 4,6-dehydratase
VKELVDRILLRMGSKLDAVVLGETHGEIVEQSLDASLARERLGWRPRFSLDEGLERTIAWYRDFFARQSDEALIAAQ